VEKLKTIEEGLSVLKTLKAWNDDEDNNGKYNTKFSKVVDKELKKKNASKCKRARK
jgi:hypothetical protein